VTSEVSKKNHPPAKRFEAQRPEEIEPSRTAIRELAGQEVDKDQRHGGQEEGQGIGAADPDQEIVQNACPAGVCRSPRKSRDQAAPEYQMEHLGPKGSEHRHEPRLQGLSSRSTADCSRTTRGRS
jgi:hypothetical protein